MQVTQSKQSPNPHARTHKQRAPEVKVMTATWSLPMLTPAGGSDDWSAKILPVAGRAQRELTCGRRYVSKLQFSRTTELPEFQAVNALQDGYLP